MIALSLSTLAALAPPLLHTESPSFAASSHALRGGLIAERESSRDLPSSVERAVRPAFEWLLAHQSADGSWRAARYVEECGVDKDDGCKGVGGEQLDVGVTALVLLALAVDFEPEGDAALDLAFRRGIGWLLQQQDAAKGRIGSNQGMYGVYDHAVATQALAVAHALAPDPELASACSKAAAYLMLYRAKAGVWRYDVPSRGDGDTSITGWSVAALTMAHAAEVDLEGTKWRSALPDCLAWLDAVTDAETGRVGYFARGERSARIQGINDQYPADAGEAMTAVGIFLRVLCRPEGDEAPDVDDQVELLLASLPEWDDDGLRNDFYYWYQGTEAMHHVRPWAKQASDAWQREVRRCLLDGQIRRGHERGSWSTDSAWGMLGGRVYTTALAALTLTRPVR